MACWRCTNYIFILNLASGFNGLGTDNYKTRRISFKFLDLVRLMLEIVRYVYIWYKSLLYFVWVMLKQQSIFGFPFDSLAPALSHKRHGFSNHQQPDGFSKTCAGYQQRKFQSYGKLRGVSCGQWIPITIGHHFGRHLRIMTSSCKAWSV